MNTASAKPDSVSMVNITQTNRCRSGPSAAPPPRVRPPRARTDDGPIGDGPVVVEGCKDLLDRGQDGVDAMDIEKCLLLTGKRGVRQVFCGCAGPHCK